MARYHLSPKDGEPRPCSAKKRCQFADTNNGEGVDHYPNKATAMEAYTEKMKYENALFRVLVKDPAERRENDDRIQSGTITDTNFRTGTETENILVKFSELSEYLTISKSFKNKVYHRGDKLEAGKIRSITENTTTVSMKPYGVLWCSLSNEDEGKETLDPWATFAKSNLKGKIEEKSLYELKLDDNAVILELNDHNVKRLEKTWMSNDYFPDGLASPYSYEEQEESFRKRERKLEINWLRLKEEGIDAVRVNGELEKGYFYGWDVDTLVVLNGKSVVQVEHRS